MASVELEAVSKSFGSVEAVKDVSLTIKDREFVVFVGPSGCGKSTLLRMIAGLEEISAGTLKIGSQQVNDTHPADRGVAMVFQSYALYPHMNVAENMGFGLKMSGFDRATIAQKVRDTAQVLQIEDLLERRPKALSGGQRQRVAIGRAIVRSPDVFLFDEPLSNLDAGLRSQMRVELARLHGELNATMIYVTHDQIEAMTLAERIVVLNEGRVEQSGPPLELYEKPANLFVAAFIGQPRMNFLPVTANGDGVLHLPAGETIPIPDMTDSGEMTLGIRPDALGLEPRGDMPSLHMTVELVEHLGNETHLHLRLAGHDRLITAVKPGKTPIASGDRVQVAIDLKGVHIFDADGKRAVSTPAAI